MRRLVFAMAMLHASIAGAGEYDATFAKLHEVEPARVHDVVGYRLPPGGDFTDVAVGRYDYKTWVMAGVALMRCDGSQCRGQHTGFGAADTVEILGVVDLMGQPANVPQHRVSGDKVPGGRAKWPVLVIRATESKPATGTGKSGREMTGKATVARTYFISLAAEDRGNAIWQETSEDVGPTGRGMRRSYKLVRGESKTTLDLIAVEQREIDRDSRCMRPDPVEIKLVLDGRHFKQIGFPVKKGC
ncbi:MAG: hypothetical protein ABI867_29680 [Kofleriaceae bacterium]